MYDNGRIKPYEESPFASRSMSARQLPNGTIARGHLKTDEHLYAGKQNGKLATTFPKAVTAQMVQRGRTRFDIYCSVCHGYVGLGDGTVVKRGFTKPPSFHEERLRTSPPGHFFDAITNGFGQMPSYATQIKTEDRWAIVAYIRALQLSQNATIADVPEDKRATLQEDKP